MDGIMKSKVIMPFGGESAGKVEVVIDKSQSGLVAIFTYRPEKGTEPPQKMLLGYRDVKGAGNMLSMEKQEDGSWMAKRDIKPNESSQFFMHPNVTAEEAPYRANIVGKISLAEGNLVESLTENHALTDAEKGQVKKYVYQQDGRIVGPVEDEYLLKEEEIFVEIYFPRGFRHSQKQVYDFQVILDGDMHLRQDPFGNSTGTKTILDNLIATGKMEATVVAFVSPTRPTMRDGEYIAMPRLREYGCNPKTATFLARLPAALRQLGIPISTEPNKIGICGQSMGGLQALYTAKIHPDVYGQVIAQSPAVWWGPNALRLAEKEPKRPVRYEDDATWRAPLANTDEQQYLLSMIQKKHDVLSDNDVPEVEINIQLQAGTHETGDCGMGDEPLTQATQRLAQELGVTCKIHDGGHSADAWATGLSVSLPNAHPSSALQQNRSPQALSVKERLVEAKKAQGTQGPDSDYKLDY